jgi:hypothetical protein
MKPITAEAHNRTLTGHGKFTPNTITAEALREAINMETNFKYVPYRNKKILQFAKGQPCQICCKNDGTTVMAHSNAMRHGKGVGKKSDDCFVAILCDFCHFSYDQKKNGITQEHFDIAMSKTWRLLLVYGVLK